MYFTEINTRLLSRRENFIYLGQGCILTMVVCDYDLPVNLDNSDEYSVSKFTKYTNE